MKPWIHSQSSARRFGGIPEDYIEIHNFMDSSKGAIADSRHRALTHTTWFLSTVLERVFGVTITNSKGRQVSVRDIGEQHCLEDFAGRFIPTPQDYLGEMDCKEWMLAGKGSPPPSFSRLSPQMRRNMTKLEQYTEAKKRAQAALDEQKEIAREAFEEGVKLLFEEHPTLSGFSWTQYTPYFNDGDECCFSAHTGWPDIWFGDFDEESFYDGSYERCRPYGKDSAEYTEEERASVAVIDYLKQFDDDTYEQLFGDHVRVKVTREGIEADDYDHD